MAESPISTNLLLLGGMAEIRFTQSITAIFKNTLVNYDLHKTYYG